MTPFSATLCRILILTAVTLSTGCAGFNLRRERFPTNAPRLPQNPTATQVVEHVNSNVAKIHGWRADDIKIHTNSVPIRLSGSLIVERDHRLRLEVPSPMGKEVDFGSNDDVFWIWVKRGEPGPNHEPPPIIFASHADMDIARQRLPMPFEPTWLMEALSVTPYSPEGMQMQGQQGLDMIRLVSQHQLSDGQKVRKEITVDARYGRVLDHTVYDMRGKPLVHAAMSDHHVDHATGAILPRYIKIDWPQAETSLTMQMGTIEVNPRSVPDAVWLMPQMPGTPVVNLGGGRAKSSPTTAIAVRPRTELVIPEAVTPARDEVFELPQLNRQRSAVQLEAPEFEAPELPEPGRARFNAPSP